jgi:hypothetical protein
VIFRKVRAPGAGRIHAVADARSLKIEIAPPVADPPLRRRLVAGGVALALGGMVALLRLSREWQIVSRGGHGAFTPGLLLLSTFAVAIAVPLAALGLLSLLFAEEVIEIADRSFSLELTVLGKTRSLRMTEKKNLRVVWTRRPVSPWWTWTFVRLAVLAEGKRHGIGATLGMREKARLKELVESAIA